MLCSYGDQIVEIHAGLANGCSMMDVISNADRNFKSILCKKSRSSLIDRSINERDTGGRCSFRLNCFCFLLPLVEIAFSVNQRQSAVSEGGKSGLGSNVRVSF